VYPPTRHPPDGVPAAGPNVAEYLASEPVGAPTADDVTLSVYELEPLPCLCVEDVGVADAAAGFEGSHGGGGSEPAHREQQHESDAYPAPSHRPATPDISARLAQW
jgi:hypothetical protein